MILTCPQCSTRYHVEAQSIAAPGRTVRCASCGNRWLAKPPADAPEVIALDPAAPRAPSRFWPVAGAAAGGRGSASLVAWLLAVLVLLVLASALIGRNEIVASFPASASLYQKLGLSIVSDIGLQFADVDSKRLEEGGVGVLVVEATIVNVTDGERPVPPIRLTLLDGNGRRLQGELFQPELALLPPGGRTSFSARLINPAEQARNYSITFELEP